MFDTEKHEVVKGSILDIVNDRKRVEFKKTYLGFISSRDAIRVYQKRAQLENAVTGHTVQVGVGRTDRGLSKNPQQDAVYWVKDLSTEPLVYWWILQSLAGDLVAETPITDGHPEQPVLHDVRSEKGIAIVNAMHSLLEEFKPTRITQSATLTEVPSTL